MCEGRRMGYGITIFRWTFADKTIGATFVNADLSHAALADSDLTELIYLPLFYPADFMGVVRGTLFNNTTLRGSRKNNCTPLKAMHTKILRGIRMSHNDLSGWDFTPESHGFSFPSPF